MIDFGVDIPEEIICLPDTLFVEKIEYGERTTDSGLIVPTEQMNHYGTFIRPRWARVKYKAGNIPFIEVGDWIALSHGRWSTAIKATIKGVETKLWYVSKESLREGLIAVSKTIPEELKEYGITED